MRTSPRLPCILPSTAYTASPSALSTFTLNTRDFLQFLSLFQFSTLFLFVYFASFALFFFFFNVPGGRKSHSSLWPHKEPGANPQPLLPATLWYQHLCVAARSKGGGEPQPHHRAAQREKAAGAHLGCPAAPGPCSLGVWGS